MRLVILSLLTLLLTNCAGTISPPWQERVTITNDRGGVITRFVSKYKRWAAQGKLVVVDGYCASSCTTAIGIIPRHNLCVTRRAIWGFHGAWARSGFSRIELPDQTHLMTDAYTSDINAWIQSKGGLKTYKTMLLMRYPETAKYFRMCN